MIRRFLQCRPLVAPASTARGRAGVAAVECAVLSPLLLYLLVITIDYGRIFYYAVTLEHCAINGAVFGSNVENNKIWYNAGSQIATIQQAAIADGANLNPPLSAGNVSVVNGLDADGNSDVEVTITYTFSTLTNFPGIPKSVTLTRTAKMRIAQP